ncbi:MAG: SDR family oxidoreductase [Pseudomonadota bacterium]
MSNLNDLARLASEVERVHGKADILFANAGLGVFAPIEQIDEAAYDKQFDINVKGAFFTVQKLLPVLNDGASIILTASAAHEKGVPTGASTSPPRPRSAPWPERWRRNWLPGLSGSTR